MPKKHVPIPQRVLPFTPPVRLPQPPQTLPSHLKEAASALRWEQFTRAAGKLRRLVHERPYAAGIVEFQIDRLLAGKEAA